MNTLTRFALFGLLVAWLALTLGVWWAATNSFDALNAAKNPAAAKLFAPASSMKMKGRSAAREVNGQIFRAWNRLQLGFGALLLFLVWRTGRLDGLPFIVVCCLLLIVCAHAFWFLPKMDALGKTLAEVGIPGAGASGKREFGRYHGAYLGTDALKACLLCGAIWLSPWRESFRGDAPGG